MHIFSKISLIGNDGFFGWDCTGCGVEIAIGATDSSNGAGGELGIMLAPACGGGGAVDFGRLTGGGGNSFGGGGIACAEFAIPLGS